MSLERIAENTKTKTNPGRHVFNSQLLEKLDALTSTIASQNGISGHSGNTIEEKPNSDAESRKDL